MADTLQHSLPEPVPRYGVGRDTYETATLDQSSISTPVTTRCSTVTFRKHFGEVLGHVVVFGGTFEVAKHLGGELAGGVDTAAFRAHAETFGSALVEFGAVLFLAVRVDSHD
jgi:hypothetical protein